MFLEQQHLERAYRECHRLLQKFELKLWNRKNNSEQIQ